MKLPPILTGIVLDPVAGTLDFSALGVGFDPRTVLGVLHEPSNRFVFAKGRQGLGYTAIAGTVMTLAADVSDLPAGSLTGFADDGALIATDARLEACRALLATASATLSNLSTALGTPSDVATGSDATAGSLIAKVTRLLGTQSGIATVLAAIRDRLPAALVGGRLSVDGSGVVQPVTVGNFPATQPVSGTVSLGAGAAQIGTIGNAFALDATAQAGNTSTAAIAAATGTSADAATASGANTSVIGALRAIRDRLLDTLAVSGTVTSNQGAAGAAAWKVDGSAVTQPVSAAALPLPAGAATAANQASEITALGAPADAAYAGAGSSSIIAALKGLYAALLAATPAGANVIGKVGIDQTTPGTTNAVYAGNRSVVFADVTSGSLTAGGGTAAVTHDAGASPSQWAKVNATFFSSQAGTYTIQASNDSGFTNAIPVATGAIPASTGVSVSLPVTFRYYRAFIVNGGTAASSVYQAMSFTAS
ncbi:hypothetical protein [Methylobacterium brachiatum]|uniref:hypothetical protein n=1 Tax=Methylobacterium brachiatum TaxID=269660 RepID=UPI000EFA51A1|nr:hypothetical protein [Methylobacterium brachiatum]AYO85319.1 hypothetical protein EBB05_25910 [Methylobacterium brachiatum]